MSRQYNFIFKELTDNDPDNILGLIAYSLYKNKKIKFIEQFKSENPESDGPNDDEINRFHRFSELEIEDYRSLARSRMALFMETLLSEHLENYKQAEKDAYKEVLAELVQEQKNGTTTVVDELKKRDATWKTHACSGVIGNAAFLVAIAALFFILGLFGNDLAGRIILWVRGVVS